jgi:hypothetical protein
VRGVQIPLKECLGAASPENPTLFLTRANSGIGMAAEDDVFRAHMGGYAYSSYAGIKDQNFCLPANSQYTLEWSIYPVASRDYYEFINALRRDWGTNFRIEGPLCFYGYYDDYKNLRRGQWDTLIAKENVAYLSTGIPYKDILDENNQLVMGPEYGQGPSILSECSVWIAMTKEILSRIAGAAHPVKRLVYMHPTLCTENDAVDKYRDARMLDDKGQQRYWLSSPKYPLFYPWLSGDKLNSYGAAFNASIDKIFDELKPDGIYFDEFDSTTYSYNYDPDVWDGHTALMDFSTYTIRLKISNTALLTQDFKLGMIKRIKDKGGVIVANRAPFTRTMSQRHFPRFVETGARQLYALPRAHLFTPIALGSQLAEADQKDVYQSILCFLDYGCLYYNYARHFRFSGNPIQKMYPITPIEIHPGYIIGEERIISKRPGVFGWNDDSMLKAYIYNNAGRLIGEQEGKGTINVNLEPRHNQLVIIERNPVVLDSIGNKEVNEGQLLEFRLTSQAPQGRGVKYWINRLPQGAKFNAQTGAFRWVPDYQQAGVYKVYFSVSDGITTDSERVQITVNNVNRPPVLAAIGNKTVGEKEKIKFSISASDPDGDNLVYSSSNLPAGAKFVVGTGTFSWVPARGQAGKYAVTFTASDGEFSDSETVNIKVNKRP